MSSCCVAYCNKYKRKDKILRFFSVPKSSLRRQKWVDCIKNEYINLSTGIFITLKC